MRVKIFPLQTSLDHSDDNIEINVDKGMLADVIDALKYRYSISVVDGGVCGTGGTTALNGTGVLK